LSLRLVAKFTRDLFHEEISLPTIEAFFKQTADSHEVTEELLLRRILQSPAIHVDETKISIRGIHQQVWGITNGRDVVFRLTETRETGFLQELLNGYQGVLVSDFYGGYDAITCRRRSIAGATKATSNGAINTALKRADQFGKWKRAAQIFQPVLPPRL
jgi:hypothetical protein